MVYISYKLLSLILQGMGCHMPDILILREIGITSLSQQMLWNLNLINDIMDSETSLGYIKLLNILQVIN